jgi:hypothetical protein
MRRAADRERRIAPSLQFEAFGLQFERFGQLETALAAQSSFAPDVVKPRIGGWYEPSVAKGGFLATTFNRGSTCRNLGPSACAASRTSKLATEQRASSLNIGEPERRLR